MDDARTNYRVRLEREKPLRACLQVLVFPQTWGQGGLLKHSFRGDVCRTQIRNSPLNLGFQPILRNLSVVIERGMASVQLLTSLGWEPLEKIDWILLEAENLTGLGIVLVEEF